MSSVFTYKLPISVKCSVWGAACKVSSVKCKAHSVARTVKCRVQRESIKCKVWSIK